VLERDTLAKQGDEAARRALVAGSGRTVRTDEMKEAARF